MHLFDQSQLPIMGKKKSKQNNPRLMSAFSRRNLISKDGTVFFFYKNPSLKPLLHHFLSLMWSLSDCSQTYLYFANFTQRTYFLQKGGKLHAQGWLKKSGSLSVPIISSPHPCRMTTYIATDPTACSTLYVLFFVVFVFLRISITCSPDVC